MHQSFFFANPSTSTGPVSACLAFELAHPRMRLWDDRCSRAVVIVHGT